MNGSADVLPDYLAPGLRAVFVGTSVARHSASVGHYYAGPGNEFWRLLGASGLTGRTLVPEHDADILAFGLGLTDLAKRRVSSSDAGLVGSDFDVRGFLAKVARYAPTWVAFHGKGAATEVKKGLGHGGSVHLGEQAWRIGGARVFVLPSASGANRDPAHLEGKPSRLAWYRELRDALDKAALGGPIESGEGSSR